MPKVIKLKKGLDISLVGEALSELNELPLQREYALVPDNFRGVVPKMLVKEGEEVKAGTPLFFDKYHPEVLFCSPVSGTLAGGRPRSEAQDTEGRRPGRSGAALRDVRPSGIGAGG